MNSQYVTTDQSHRQHVMTKGVIPLDTKKNSHADVTALALSPENVEVLSSFKTLNEHSEFCHYFEIFWGKRDPSFSYILRPMPLFYR